MQLPAQVAEADLVFDTHFTVPQGCLRGIRYVLFIPPEAYFALPTPQQRRQLAGQINRINTALAGQPFICVGPGTLGHGQHRPGGVRQLCRYLQCPGAGGAGG